MQILKYSNKRSSSLGKPQKINSIPEYQSETSDSLNIYKTLELEYGSHDVVNTDYCNTVICNTWASSVALAIIHD